MFNKILIANRGEIACRIIKTAKRLGIKTVAVYSDADANALHVKHADEAIRIGEAPSNQSYLLIDRIIAAAQKTGAEAIHPGYGFLSENTDFAESCIENNIVFIGPPAEAIKAMGSKSAAKSIMQQAKVPLVPGYHGEDQSAEKLKAEADAIGYPVLLKAVAGGGGKGMRQVWGEEEFMQALTEAKRESLASFGDEGMLVEKYLTQPRHVEVQVFCDTHNNGVYLFERDCSLQRRHQKIIEEAPAPNITPELRQAMGETAVRAAQTINYEGAGTVEFLLDADGSFYFMEMNTRLQVEHPVTEMITGQDLVECQFKVANGEELPLAQDQLQIRGHAFEARVYAEDPTNDFLPTSGTLSSLKTPQQSEFVRIDTGVVSGDEVTPFYDPMIAKLIVWGKNRDIALQRLSQALREYQITGVTTNIDFLYDLATHPAFVKADLDTGFIEKHQTDFFEQSSNETKIEAVQMAAIFLHLTSSQHDENDPWTSKNAWRMNQSNIITESFAINDEVFDVEIEILKKTGNIQAYTLSIKDQVFNASAELNDNGSLVLNIDGHKQSVNVVNNGGELSVFTEKGKNLVTVVEPDLGEDLDRTSENAFIAPMNSTVIDLLVNSGDKVAEGQAVLVLEAMKMQQTLAAPSDGVITELYCKQGDLVEGGSQLVAFEPAYKA